MTTTPVPLPSADLAEDRARVTILIRAAPASVFRLFTEDIDRWWRTGLAYRVGKHRSMLHLEPKVGGRIYERFNLLRGADDAASERVVQTGTITHWEPPSLLCFDWRAVNFKPGESTQVEVRFAASPSGTLVTLTHCGWSKIREDHPVRHGEAPEAFLRSMGLWWGGLLNSLRAQQTG